VYKMPISQVSLFADSLYPCSLNSQWIQTTLALKGTLREITAASILSCTVLALILHVDFLNFMLWLPHSLSPLFLELSMYST
jgi:hypothetical protein